MTFYMSKEVEKQHEAKVDYLAWKKLHEMMQIDTKSQMDMRY